MCAIIKSTKKRGGKKHEEPSKPSLPLESFTQETSPDHFLPCICGSEQLQRMYSERCTINSCMLMVGEKEECLLRRRAIYHGKYVHPRPVKGWWFCSSVTSDIRPCVGRELIKATSITQPDNLWTRGKTNDGCELASIACLTSSSSTFTVKLFSLSLYSAL